jgi:hypothetical protein
MAYSDPQNDSVPIILVFRSAVLVQVVVRERDETTNPTPATALAWQLPLL